jgi:lipoprotein signal peptidase
MQGQRSFRWLFVTLAVAGLAADQATKYGMFRWLHNGGQESRDGSFSFAVAPNEFAKGEFDLLPGWFRFTAEFDLRTAPSDGSLSSLQTWSAPVMPRVNHGALFGFGSGHKASANSVFAAISVLAAAAIVVWAGRRGTAQDRWLCMALGLILGGTVGNLYDRVVFGGVRDFLYFYRIEWPVFNVADCCLVIGACLLLVQALLVPGHRQQPVPAAVEVQPAAAVAG